MTEMNVLAHLLAGFLADLHAAGSRIIAVVPSNIEREDADSLRVVTYKVIYQ